MQICASHSKKKILKNSNDIPAAHFMNCIGRMANQLWVQYAVYRCVPELYLY